MSRNVLWFSDLGLADLEQVGGKNSSLGEMVSHLAEVDHGTPSMCLAAPHAPRCHRTSPWRSARPARPVTLVR